MEIQSQNTVVENREVHCICAVADGGTWSVPTAVSVGYEYESCLDLTLWEKRTAILQGYELDASNMGGWTLDKHHVLDVQNGKVGVLVPVAHLHPDCFMQQCILCVMGFAWVSKDRVPRASGGSFRMQSHGPAVPVPLLIR